VFSYYKSQSDINFNSKNISTIDYFNNKNVNSLFSASGSAEMIAYLIDEVFEFNSKDGSGIYNINNDIIQSSVSYSNVLWKPMKVIKYKDTLYPSVSSKDNRHNFTWMMSGYDNLNPLGINLQTSINYPYKQKDTYTALKMFICGANAEGSLDFSLENNNTTLKLVSGKSKIFWNKNEVSLTIVESDINVELVAKDYNIIYSIISIMEAKGSAKAYCKIIYYSFNNRNILWNLSVSYGTYIAEIPKNIIPILILGIIFGVIIIFLFILIIKHIYNKKRRLRIPLLDGF